MTVMDTQLDRHIRAAVAQGHTLILRDANHAVLRPPEHRPAHVVHAILSLLTLGLWLWVWLIVTLVANARKPSRYTIYVDNTGKIGWTYLNV